jgi:class 3 adenylate cyclase
VRCEACGAQVGLAARFCDRCGVPVAPASAPVISGLDASSGDRRIVTALFADLVDYVRMVAQEDPEVVHLRVMAALDAMAAAVERYGGTREKFIGDAIFAVFGWPKAHDDDAVRGVLCGLAIREALTHLGGEETFEVRIGVATGEVVAMHRDGSLDEGRLTGPAIVTAARLQSLARPGEVLVDEMTVRAGRDRLEVVDRGTIVLRGHAAPVHVLEVVRDVRGEGWNPETPRTRGPFVGRHAELARIEGVLDACAEAGRGGVVLLEGEAGIGKSRLLAHVEAHVRARGLAWTWTENVSYGGGEPYRFVRVLAQALADEHGTDSGSLARRLLFTPDVDPVVVRRYGGAIAAIARDASFSGWEAEAGDMPEDPGQVAAVLLEVAGRYIDRLAETAGPRVIVIDDLHWLDDSSRGMISLLVERASRLPLVVLVAMRPSGAPTWAQDPHVMHLRLGGLKLPESSQLATLIARAALDAEDARRIHERTAGNPLFLTETVRSFLEDGTLVEQEGRLTLDDDARRPVLPITLRAVLGARIDALDEAARSVLDVASVLGTAFRLDLLEELVQSPGSREHLQRLADARLVTPVDDERWRFGHALIREAVYESMLARRRREIHGLVADHLELRHPEPPLARIARHRVAAGDRARAVPLLDEAARAALGVGRCGRRPRSGGRPRASPMTRSWRIRSGLGRRRPSRRDPAGPMPWRISASRPSSRGPTSPRRSVPGPRSTDGRSRCG